MKPVAAEPLDGKGNDVCPCFFGITEAVLNEDETITVSGPCAVANPPETVTVRVQVQGERGARAIGSDSFECRGSETSQETFSLSVRVRGDSRFETGDTVAIRASVHINPDDKPAVAGRWTWTGPLT